MAEEAEDRLGPASPPSPTEGPGTGMFGNQDEVLFSDSPNDGVAAAPNSTEEQVAPNSTEEQSGSAPNEEDNGGAAAASSGGGASR